MHKFVALFLFSALAVAVAPKFALAQVNSERMRVGDPQPGFSGVFDGGLTVKKGNVDFLKANASTRIEYNTGIHTPYVQGNLSLAQRSGADIINNGFVHARWTAMWHPRVGSELFSQLQFNEFISLRLRSLIGAGVRAVVHRGETFEMFAATGYMLENERLNLSAEQTFPTSDPNYHGANLVNHRSTSYITFRYNFTDVLMVNHTVFFQPRIDDPGDFRVLDETGLEVRITDFVSLLTGLSIKYDSRPPHLVKNTDLMTQNSLRLRF